MTKADIVACIAKSTGMTKTDTAVIVDELLTAISEALVQGKKIEIRGFGTFKVQLRKPRIARNPKTGTPIQLPERVVPVFKPSDTLKARVAQHQTQPQ